MEPKPLTAADPRPPMRLGRRVAVLVWLLFLAPTLGELSAADRGVAEILDLRPEALGRFVELQDGWLEWLAASYQGDQIRAATAARSLLDTTRALGMQRLPDLSLGAAGRAMGFAREGRFDVARWCLEAAETFDPDRPEVAVAAARVAWLEGRYWTALRQSFEGLSRMFRENLLVDLWRANLGHWLLFIVLATGALYVAILMATRGVELFHDLLSFFRGFVPDLVALLLALILLIWPVLLPAGLLWLTLYWSILLWGYGTLSQKLVLVGLWVMLGVSPILINEQRQRVRVALAPTTLSMERLGSGRLQGGLFGDLAALRTALPHSAAVTHLLADLHCRLGEWRSASTLYEGLLEREPANGPALVNLGVCYLNLGDRARALDSFQKAAQSGDATPAARFNMSQVLSELYQFREAEHELGIAQRLAPESVRVWLRRAESERAVMLDGGLARSSQIRGQLTTAWRDREADARWSAMWPRVLSLPLALAFIIIAAGLHLVVRRRSRVGFQPVWPIAPRGTWRRVLLPGLAEAESDRPLLALVVLFVLVVPASLALVGDLGYRLPLIYAPGGGLGILALVGVGLLMVLRWLGHRRGGFG